MSDHQIIQENLTCPLRNDWNLVCRFSLRCWATIYTKFYFIWTSMAPDIAHWRLLIKSYFLPTTWRLATSLALGLSDTRISISSDSTDSELKIYIPICIDFVIGNLKITLIICGNVTSSKAISWIVYMLHCPIFKMPGYTYVPSC